MIARSDEMMSENLYTPHTLPKIALFGGSFDPLHNGHLGIMHAVLGELGIEHLIILPTFCSPFKSRSLLSPQARLSLCELTAAHLAECYPKARIEVCDFEIARAKPTYSIESVRYLQARLRQECAAGRGVDSHYSSQRLGFVLGWDNFESFHLWRDFTSLARALHLFVFDRGGHSEGEFRTLLEGFGIASLRARFIPFARAVSSTRIRERLSRGDFSEIPPFLLPTLKKFLQKPCYNGTQNSS